MEYDIPDGAEELVVCGRCVGVRVFRCLGGVYYRHFGAHGGVVGVLAYVTFALVLVFCLVWGKEGTFFLLQGRIHE